MIQPMPLADSANQPTEVPETRRGDRGGAASGAGGCGSQRPSTCRTIPVRELDDGLVAAWKALRADNPALYSPFFSPEFTLAVDEVRDDGQIAIVERSGEPIAFLPFHRSGRSLFPIGRTINDAHGLICAHDTTIDWHWLLQQLDATGYEYHALFSSSDDAGEHAFGWTKAFLCDLTASDLRYDLWLEQNRKTIFKQRRKTKKLIRDEGPLRLEYASTDPAVLDRLIQLKREQYQRTRIFDIFSVDWIRNLLHLMLTRDGALQGRLSALYAGDKLVAMHMGMQEGKLLHYWFPVYDQAFGYASPGTALFLEIVRQAEANRIDKIDFGYGELPYKWTLNNVIDSVPHGAICVSHAAWHARRLRGGVMQTLKALPGKEWSKRVLRKVHPQFGRGRYH
ncbi:GNAT family N-acetyltransferase [Rosistilla oblonga]|uniref:GNAT family N-acetyltransferase n=1 Tax=Rosistilla oblonga TaxID=2527990 RepID=UPI003A985F2B